MSSKEHVEEELAAVGRVARALRELLGHLLVSYAFFTFGLAIMGSALTLGPLLVMVGLEEGASVGIGVLAGIILASILFHRIYKLLCPEPSGTSTVGFLILIAPFMLIPLATSLVAPSRVQVSWFPALGLYLIGLYLNDRTPEMRHHLYAGLAIILLTPPVLLLNDPMLAMGATGLVYLVTGAASLERGLRKAGAGGADATVREG